MNDTIVDQNIRRDNFRRVDENAVVLDRDCDIGTIHCLECGVAENATVTHDALYNVIFKDGSQLHGA